LRKNPQTSQAPETRVWNAWGYTGKTAQAQQVVLVKNQQPATDYRTRSPI